jgi:hypothetical protein
MFNLWEWSPGRPTIRGRPLKACTIWQSQVATMVQACEVSRSTADAAGTRPRPFPAHE